MFDQPQTRTSSTVLSRARPEESPRCGVAALHRAVSEGDAVEVLRPLAPHTYRVCIREGDGHVADGDMDMSTTSCLPLI